MDAKVKMQNISLLSSWKLHGLKVPNLKKFLLGIISHSALSVDIISSILW